MCSIKIFLESKQADSNSKSLLARSIGWLVGSFLFLSNLMKAERERERFVANICACYAYISRSWNRSIDRSIFFFFFFMLHLSSRGRNVGLLRGSSVGKGRRLCTIVKQHAFLRYYPHCIATALSTIDLPFLTGGIESLFFPFCLSTTTSLLYAIVTTFPRRHRYDIPRLLWTGS